MKKYDNYKDSGVEWIGEIPSHWKTTTLKRIVEVKDGTHDTPGYVEVGIPFITTKDLENGKISFENCKYINQEDYLLINKRSNVTTGDIIMPMIGSIGSPIIVKTDRPFSIKNLALIKNNINNDLRYICYYLNSESTLYQFGLSTSGGVQNFISLGVLRNLSIPKITIEEQTAIANYLDHKTFQIDHLIAKKEQFIKLLEEERVAVINQAVTKGLDPNVPMKDSGVEWLGEIPEHWEVKKLKYISQLISNKAKEKPNYIIALENIESWSGNIIGDPTSNLMEGDAQLFESGDVLFNKLRPYLAKVTLMKNSGGAMGELLVLRPLKLVKSEFLFQRLRSEMIITIVDGSTYGTKMPRASWDKFISQLEIGIPPLNEQINIFEFIEIEERRINLIITKTQQEIELLKEYKTALISEVVTGKVDVSTSSTQV